MLSLLRSCIPSLCIETSNIEEESKYDYLKEIDYNNTEKFIVPINHGKVVKVYDGDTITIASKLTNDKNSIIYRFSIRLKGIDSPEIKSKVEKEKKLAEISRDALHSLIYGKIITLKNINTEKYGRVLADIYIENLHINNWMIESHYAIPYNGGTKIRPSSWNE
jgi:micrococcal nuclease